jgi:serine/threonine-protein kinase
MNVSYKCPHCQSEISADITLCGDALKCPNCGEESKIPIPGIYKGLKLGGFVVEELLGIGGMGEVWLAHQEKLDRKVALKILSPKYISNSSFVERFMSEVRNTAKLEHPNIVTAFHAGVENGIYFLAISYVSGQPVIERLRDGKAMPEKESLSIARAIADALNYAWNEFRILHRDIKPGNIMVDKKGIPKLMDMGISKSLDDDTALTMMGMMVGTPYYISPEQAVGARDIDFRADIYSLGATLYHMVTGIVPYDAGTAMAIITKHLQEPLPDPRNYNSSVSDQTVSLLHIMMAKNKDDRQKSWQALVDDLDKVMHGEYPITPRPDANKTALEAHPAADGKIAPTNEKQTKIEKDKDLPPLKKNGSSLKIVLIIILTLFFLAAVSGAGIFLVFKFLIGKEKKRTAPLPTELTEKANKKRTEKAGEKLKIEKPEIQEPEKATELQGAEDTPVKPLPPPEQPAPQEEKSKDDKKDSRSIPAW